MMRVTKIVLLTGAASILLAGYAGLAEAKGPESHVLTLRLPDGQIEQVQYTGDVPPTVIVAPDIMPTEFDPVSPITMLRQMTADMDRQAAILFHDIAGLRMPGLTMQSAAGYSAIPALSGPGVCMRSVQITYPGNGLAPSVLSQTSGDCASVNGPSNPVALPDTPAPQRAHDVIQAKATSLYQGLIHPVSDWQR